MLKSVCNNALLSYIYLCTIEDMVVRPLPHYSPPLLCKTKRSFQRKNATCQSSSSKQTRDKRMMKQMWKGGWGKLEITSIILVPKLMSFAYKSTILEDIWYIEFQRCYGDRTLLVTWRAPSANADDIKIGVGRAILSLKIQSLIIYEGTLAGQWIKLQGREGGDVGILNIFVSYMASERSANWNEILTRLSLVCCSYHVATSL